MSVSGCESVSEKVCVYGSEEPGCVGVCVWVDGIAIREPYKASKTIEDAEVTEANHRSFQGMEEEDAHVDRIVVAIQLRFRSGSPHAL